MSSRFALGALCIVGTVTIWAGWYVVIRLGLTSTSLDVQDLAALRFGVAGILMLPVVWRRGLALDRLGWRGLLAIVLGGGAPFALLVGAGLVYAPVSHASALTQGMVPLAVGLVAAIVLKERLTAPHLLGFALIVAGAVMIAGISLAALASRETIGHAFFVAAAFLWAGYTVALRKAHLEGLHAPAIAAVASLVFYVPVYLFFRGEHLLAAPVQRPRPAGRLPGRADRRGIAGPLQPRRRAARRDQRRRLRRLRPGRRRAAGDRRARRNAAPLRLDRHRHHHPGRRCWRAGRSRPRPQPT